MTSKVKVIFADRTMIGVLDSSVDELQWLIKHSLIPFGEVVRHTYGSQTFVRYENRGQVITAYAYDMPIESLNTEQPSTTIMQQPTTKGDNQMDKRTYVININDGEWWHVDNYRTVELDYDETTKLEEMTPAQRREFAVNKGQRIAGAQ